MRIKNCAECSKEIPYGEMMFVVYWSVDSGDKPPVYFICLSCAQDYTREKMVPGGRI